jgi:hypothetical protein
VLTPLYQTLMPLGRSTRPASGAAFTPTQVAGLKLWLEADGTLWQDSARTTSAAADGDPVGAWDDGSGLANHATQATSTKRPTLKLAIQNGRPVVRFDGVDDFLAVAASLTLKPASVFVACSATSFVVRALLGQAASGTGALGFRFESGTNLTVKVVGIGTIASAPVVTSAGAAFQVGLTYTAGGVYAVYYDRVQKSTGTSNSPAVGAGAPSIASGYGNGENWPGDIYEFLVYDSALSDPDRQSVEDYLKGKWNLP